MENDGSKIRNGGQPGAFRSRVSAAVPLVVVGVITLLGIYCLTDLEGWNEPTSDVMDIFSLAGSVARSVSQEASAILDPVDVVPIEADSAEAHLRAQLKVLADDVYDTVEVTEISVEQYREYGGAWSEEEVFDTGDRVVEEVRYFYVTYVPDTVGVEVYRVFWVARGGSEERWSSNVAESMENES